MTEDNAPKIEMLEKALGEYRAKGAVRTVLCERCGTMLVIRAKGESVLLVECKCGAYNDTLRGI